MGSLVGTVLGSGVGIRVGRWVGTGEGLAVNVGLGDGTVEGLAVGYNG